MAYDDVFPSLARPPRNVRRQMDGSLPLSKISNYIMNVFCLVFSKPTEINVMFVLFPKLLHVFSMCFSGLLISLKQRGFIEHGALFPKIQSPVAICLCWLAWSESRHREHPCLSFTLGFSKDHHLLRMPLARSGISKIHHSGANVCSGSPLSEICFNPDKCLVWFAASKSQRFRRHAFSSPALNIMTRSENIMTRSQKSMYGVSAKPLNDIQHGLVPLFFLFFKNCRHGTL
jgi:hypothetical protein